MRNRNGRITIIMAIYLMIAAIALCRMASAQPIEPAYGDANMNGVYPEGADYLPIFSMTGRTNIPNMDINLTPGVDDGDARILGIYFYERSRMDGMILTDPRNNKFLAKLIPNTIGDDRVRFSPSITGNTSAGEERMILVNGAMIPSLGTGLRFHGVGITVNGNPTRRPLFGSLKGWWLSKITINGGVQNANVTYFVEATNSQSQLVQQTTTGTVVVNPPLPDLGVTDNEVLPAGPYLAGQTVSIHGMIRLTSTQGLQNVLVRGYARGANNQMVQLDGDVRLNFAAGTDAKPVSFPATLSAGINRIHIIVDPLNAVLESKKNNNQTTSTITTQIPNVSVSSISVSPVSTIEGAPQNITGTIVRTGLPDGYVVRAQLSVNGTPVATETSTTGQMGFRVAAPSGRTTYAITVDPANMIAESSEGDNMVTTVVTNLLPDVIAISATAPATVTVGEPFTVTATMRVANMGIRHSVIVRISDGPTTLRTRVLNIDPAVIQGNVATYTDTVSVNSPGNHRIAIKFDSTDILMESNESNNTATAPADTRANLPPGPPAPRINLVTPGNGQIVIGWTPATGATGYEVGYGSTPGTISSTQIVTTTGDIKLGLANNTAIYATVRSVGPGGRSTWSAWIGAAPGVNPAMVVEYNGTHLVQPAYTDARAELNWTVPNSWKLVRGSDNVFRFYGTFRRQAFTGSPLEQESNLVDLDASAAGNPWGPFLLDAETTLVFRGANNTSATAKRRANNPPPGATHFVGQNAAGEVLQLTQ